MGATPQDHPPPAEQPKVGSPWDSHGNPVPGFLEERRSRFHRWSAADPGKLPVIMTKAPRSFLPEIAKKSFMVSGTMLCSELSYIVRKRITESSGAAGLTSDQTIYFFVNRTAPKT